MQMKKKAQAALKVVSRAVIDKQCGDERVYL